jgi:hypothetical protein
MISSKTELTAQHGVCVLASSALVASRPLCCFEVLLRMALTWVCCFCFGHDALDVYFRSMG